VKRQFVGWRLTQTPYNRLAQDDGGLGGYRLQDGEDPS
jgi:hypothetical protein